MARIQPSIPVAALLWVWLALAGPHLPAQSSTLFPHIGAGSSGSASIQTVLQAFNPNSTDSCGSFEFFDDDGTPLALEVDGAPAGAAFDFRIAPGEARRYVLTSPGPARDGWLRIVFDSAAEAAFTAVFQLEQDGVESRTGVLPSPPLVLVRLVFDRDGDSLDMGIAVANPEDFPLAVTFVLSDAASGQELGRTIVPLPARGHLARFVSELFAAPATAASGLAHLSVVSPLSPGLPMTALRLHEGRLSTVPTAVPAPAARILPQIGVGRAGDTEIRTVVYLGSQLDDRTVSGRARLRDSSGAPLQALLDCQAGASEFQFQLPPRQARRFVLCGGEGLRSGWLSLEDLVRDGGGSGDGADLVASAVFQIFEDGALVSEAGVLAAPRTPLASTFVSARPGGTDTGVALVNPTDGPLVLNAELYDGATRELIAQRQVEVAAFGHRAAFARELFPDALAASAAPFTGILSLWERSGSFSATALQQDQLLLTAIPTVPRGVFAPIVTELTIGETRDSPAEFDFELEVVDLDRDLLESNGDLELLYFVIQFFDFRFGFLRVPAAQFRGQQTIRISSTISLGGPLSGIAFATVSLSDAKGSGDGVVRMVEF